MIARETDHPQVVVLPPLLVAGGFVLGLVAEYFWRTQVVAANMRFTLGPLLFILGLAIMLWAVREFRRAGTHVEVYRPATALVVTGPYRYTRNPIYLAMVVAYFGAAILADSLWVLALSLPIALVLHYGVILREERYLAAKFGTTYQDYMRSVRRWI